MNKKKNTNINLRKVILEAVNQDIRDDKNKKVFTADRKLVLYELAMAYNPDSMGCILAQDELAKRAYVSPRTVKRTISLASEYLGLRWIHIDPVKKQKNKKKGKFDSNSYDFRHFDSCFNSAFRGDGKVFNFADRGNIDEPFNGKTLSFNPFRESAVSFDSPLKNGLGVGSTCPEWKAWYFRTINSTNADLANAIDDHRKILGLSDAEAWDNAQVVIKSDLDDANRVALVRYCIRKNYRRIDPSRWEVKESNDDDKALADAKR